MFQPNTARMPAVKVPSTILLPHNFDAASVALCPANSPGSNRTPVKLYIGISLLGTILVPI